MQAAVLSLGEAMRVNVFYGPQGCCQVLPLWPDGLRVTWVQSLREILELWLQVYLQLSSACSVHWL